MHEQHDNNNFNILRIFLSLGVVCYHIHVLSQKAELSILSKIFDADRCVQGFFIVSGYLVMKSYSRSHSVKEYFIKRLKRIYPAYLVVILLSVIMGMFITTYSLPYYFSSPELYKYIGANISFLNFLQPSLPGVFEENYLTAVNGSLWTLKIEVSFYLIVPVLFFLRKKMNAHLLYGLLFGASLGYHLATIYLYNQSNTEMYMFLSRQLPGQLFYFILGAWVNEIDTKSWFKPAIISLGVPCLIGLFLPIGVAAGSIALAIVVFFVAIGIPAIPYPLKKEDISYGLYIYHFPVIQTLVYFGFFDSALNGPLLSIVITVVLACLSWLVVEKPFIVKKASYKTGMLAGKAVTA